MSLRWTNQHITKPLITTCIMTFLLFCLIIIWIVFGEFDVLNLNWIVPHMGVLWHGKLISLNLATDLFERYSYQPQFGYSSAQEFWNECQYQNINVINTLGLIFNPWLLLILFGVICMGILIPLIGKIFGCVELDVLPFSLASTIGFSILIISHAIPIWNDISVWIIRIVIVLLTILISFVAINTLVITFWLKQPYADNVIKQMQSRDQQISTYRKTLQELKDQYIKQDKIDSVEVDKSTS